jgi:RNA-directed DNA polymerase
MAKQTTDYESLWRSIEQAGNINSYIESQLRELGYLVERRDTDGMSKRKLADYKKSLKAEAEEKRRLKRQVWKAYQTKHIVHLGEGVYWNDLNNFDRWDLDEPEKRASENELPPLDKPSDLAEMLNLSIPQLRWLAFHRDAATSIHYTRFTIPKRDGTEREIWAPLPILKEAQRWILFNIVEKLLVHGAAHGFLAGRSIATNASIHTDSRIILKMDMRNFFPTVTYRRVKGIFRKAGYREQIATLLGLICTESPREIIEHQDKKYFVSLGPRSLPQGAPTSPGISNAICLKLDGRLSGLAKKFGWRYTRYADDLTFSLPNNTKGKTNLGALCGCVKKIVADEGFLVHPDKTRVIRKGSSQRVTGLVVNDKGAPRATRTVRRNIRAAINNLSNGKSLREGESLDTLRGMAAFISMTDRELGNKLMKQINETDRVEPKKIS